MSLYYEMCELYPCPFIDTEGDRAKYIEDHGLERYYNEELAMSPETEEKVMQVYNDFFKLVKGLSGLKEGETRDIEGIGTVRLK